VLREQSSTSPLYDRNLALVVAIQACFVVANTLMAHYARWIDFLGGPVRQVGWIIGTGAILGMVLRPWMGEWINRLGSRKMWFVGFALFALGCLANALLVDLHPSIYLLRSCLAVGGAVVFVSSLTYISQTTAPDRRTEAIGIVGAGGMLGMLLGPALGDLLLSSEPARENFVLLFAAAACGCVVPSILLCLLRPAAVQSPGRAVGVVSFVRTVRQYWPGAILLVGFAFGVCMLVPFVFLASFIDQASLRIPGISIIGLFFWCYAGWGISVRIMLRRLPDLLGRRKVLLVGMLFMSGGMFFFCFCSQAVTAQHPWIIVVPALLAGTGHGLAFHTMTSLIIEPFPNALRGTGTALALMMMDFGMLAGAPVLGQIADTRGYGWMFAAIGLLSLTAAAAYGYASIPVWQQRRRTRFPTVVAMAGGTPPSS